MAFPSAVLMAFPVVMTCCQRPVAISKPTTEKYFTNKSTFTISTDGPTEGTPMSDHADSLRNDISFMRNMAEQGRHGPILGGAFLAAAGLTYGAAAVLQWLVEKGTVALPIPQIWIGAS